MKDEGGRQKDEGPDAVVRPANAEAALRVMSFNLRYDNPDDAPHDWPARRPRAVGLLAFHRPDVLGVQEALAHQLQHVREGLPGYGCVGVGRDDGREAGEFAAILYREDRLMLRASGTFWLSESPDAPGSLGWGAGLPRICTWARLIDRVTGQAMLHLNTHLDNRSPDARHHGAKLILERAAGLAEAGDAVILTGDMNCVAGSEPHEVFTSQLQDAADAAELELGERVTTGGFVTRPRPDDGSTPGPPTDRRIDYIFTTPNLRVSRYAVLSQHWRGRHASDHYPILADVELQHVV